MDLARTGNSNVHDGIVHNKALPEEAIGIILANSGDLVIKGMAAAHPNAPADQRKYLGGYPSGVLYDFASIANPRALPADVIDKTEEKDEVIRAAFVERFKRMAEESSLFLQLNIIHSKHPQTTSFLRSHSVLTAHAMATCSP